MNASAFAKSEHITMPNYKNTIRRKVYKRQSRKRFDIWITVEAATLN